MKGFNLVLGGHVPWKREDGGYLLREAGCVFGNALESCNLVGGEGSA